ncbi:MAG TPA: alpha/beta hydrolase [Steroidobacteraceae bacterium]|nr:alpha/beta hydrolase [Steroidobacteraceae bacterium]
MHKHRFSAFNGVTLAADVAGDPESPPVVLMHGGGQTRHSWGTAADALARRGHHVISLDLRGHGDSDWAPDCDYSLGAFSSDLHCVLRTLRRAPAIVGASLGGLTGLLAVGESEQPIASALILVDIVPKVDMEGAARIHGFMTSHPEGFATVEDAAAAVAEYLPHRPRPKDVSGLRKNLRAGADGRLYWHWDPKFMSLSSTNPQEAIARINRAAQRVRIPTLLIRGEHSEIVSDEGVDAFKAMIPHAEYVDVKGARHMVAGDENSAFNGALLDFLRRVHSNGGAQ